jgi:hypothetical protein
VLLPEAFRVAGAERSAAYANANEKRKSRVVACFI